MKPIRAVIFDLDGTLLDTLDNIAAAVNCTLAAYDMPPRSREQVRSFVGNGVKNLIDRAVADGTDEQTTARVLADFKPYYAEHTMDFTVPYDGILPALDRLKAAGIKMAVVSNKPDASTAALCRRFFADYIDVAYGDHPDRPRKPAPDSTFDALARLRVPADEAIFVGDGDADVQTAINAGIPCLSVTWGFRDAEDLRNVGATVFADTPAQMADYILNGRD
jgi:phosphoglycolate phosphatase